MRVATLYIFAKPPRIGLSKTRLARSMGAAEARRIASMTLARTLRACMCPATHVVVCITPDQLARAAHAKRGFSTFLLQSQGEGGLTERLTRAFDRAPSGPVLFIGCDAPGVSRQALRKAIRALRRADAVFGPALDGGFWLFGMHKRPRAVAPFRNVRWSTPHALDDVRRCLPPACRVKFIDPLLDIDNVDDWRAWCRSARQFPQKPA